MKKYSGIKSLKMKDGTTSVQVRFKHHGKNYGVRNFTTLFGCRTEKKAYEKLQEVKALLSQGINPFDKTSLKLNDLWDKRVLTATWAENTRKNYIIYYNLVIRNSIGKKQIGKIKYNDIISLKDSLSDKSISYQNRLKVMLNPLFDEAIIKEQITMNPFHLIKNKVAKTATPISKRINEDEESIVKKLYSTLMNEPINWHRNQNEETRIFFLLLLLTAHRFGELMQLKKENIYGDKIVSPTEITKTKKDYDFPMPLECKEYIENIENGKLFPNLTRGKVSVRFEKLVEHVNLTSINNSKLTPHDVRRLFMIVCIKNGMNESLTDYCLEHSQRGVKASYLHFNYQQKVEVFEKYWEIIKN